MKLSKSFSFSAAINLQKLKVFRQFYIMVRAKSIFVHIISFFKFLFFYANSENYRNAKFCVFIVRSF